MQNLNILALGHEASLTGAPILLQEFLRWAVDEKVANIRCAIHRGGPLAQEMPEICNTHIVRPVPETTSDLRRALNKAVDLTGLRILRLQRWLKSGPKPDVIYVNTIASIPLLRSVLKTFRGSIPVVIHVHELTWMIEKYMQSHGIQAELRAGARLIAASNAVADALVSTAKIDQSGITRIHEWLCRDRPAEQDRNEIRNSFRNRLGVKKDEIVCVGLGLMQWRKGSDLLAMLAAECQNNSSPLHFVWAGKASEDQKTQLEIEASQLGVRHYVHIVGELEDPSAALAAGDIFTLLSREDPYPLAMLEAALFGMPIVCFDKSGGAPELVSNNCGISVPYLDLKAFADAIKTLANDQQRRFQLGENGRNHVLTNHSLQSTAPQILQVLESCCSQNDGKR